MADCCVTTVAFRTHGHVTSRICAGQFMIDAKTLRGFMSWKCISRRRPRLGGIRLGSDFEFAKRAADLGGHRPLYHLARTLDAPFYAQGKYSKREAGAPDRRIGSSSAFDHRSCFHKF
jgi:hypothetical protein